jgi:hypothetical protein
LLTILIFSPGSTVTFIGLNMKFFMVMVTLLAAEPDAPATDETPKDALVASRTPMSVRRSALLALVRT